MGLLAAAGAAVSIGVAAADIAVVGLTLTTALEVTVAVGATIGAIGTITGNKDLALAGMALGIVGGVGALASNAGLFGAAGNASLFGDSGAAAEAAGGDAGSAGLVPDMAGEATGADAGAAGLVPDMAAPVATAPADGTADIVDAMGNTDLGTVSPTSAIGNQSALTSGDSASLINGSSTAPPVVQSSTSSADVTGATNVGALSGPAPDAGIGTVPGAATGGPSGPAVAVTGSPAPANLSPEALLNAPNANGFASGGAVQFSQGGSSPGVIGSLLNFAKNNPTVTMGMLQAGGSFLSGLTSPVTPAQVNALNAQAAANRAAASMSQLQQTNMSQPLPTATRSPVTGTPAPLIGNPGIINQTQQAA